MTLRHPPLLAALPLLALLVGATALGCDDPPAPETEPARETEPEPVTAPVPETPSAEPARAPRPNIVLISIDSLRAGHLGCYGYARPTSPSIDALAAQGVVFTDVVSSTSWTLPAHASMFTGLPSSVHGCDTSNVVLAPQRVTVAEALRDAGYRTAGFWSGPYLHPIFGLGQGFEQYVNCASFPFYEAEEGDKNRRRGQREANRQSHADVTSPKIVEEVEKWLRGAGDEPFFLFVHMWDVHFDYIPPAPYDTRFDPDYSGPIDGRNLISLKADIEERDLEHLIALYDGEIAWTDEHVGKIVALVDELGLGEDTAILLTADHGEEFFEHGKFGHRNNLFGESIAVPLVIRYPRMAPAGQRVDALVGVGDIAPTLLDLAGAEPFPDIVGSSLVPLLEDRDANRGHVAISELTIPRKNLNHRVIRSGDWKLLVDFESGETMGFWNLAEDPGEKVNLVRKGHELTDEVQGVLRRTTASLRRLSRLHKLDERAEAAQMPPEIEDSLRKLGYIGDDE